MEMMVAEELFASGGEMGALMRSLDWSQTLLGSVSKWAQSLKIALSIILTSRCPMFIWWGADYANLYNDAYRPLLGASKHPQFLGQSAKDCWADIWDVVGPLADSVLTTGQPTWSEDILLLVDRNGYLEETYFTFSYSPLRDESGGVGGVLCGMTETTGRIIAQRRLRTLRKLAAKTAEAKSVEEACHIAMTTLSINPHDIPFALLYRVEPDGKAHLAGTTGIEAATIASLEPVDLYQENEPNESNEAFRWSLAKVNRTGKAELVSNLPTQFGVLPKEAWSEQPSEVLVIPIAQSGKAQQRGLLVVGISPRREFDDDYQGFLDLIASHVATAIANADAVAVEESVGLVSDISGRKQAEIALQKSEERLRLAQRAAGAGLWDWDIVADCVTWSEEYYQLYGLKLATTPSYENWMASIWEPDREQVERTTREVLEHRTNLNAEFRVFHPIHGLRWLTAIGQTFYDANDKPIRMTGITLDITVRKQAEAELQQTLQTLTTLIKASPLPIVVIKPNMTVQLWNPAAEQLFGWSEAEVLGQPIPIVPEEKRDECRQVREAVAKGEVFAGVDTYRCRRDGATVMVSICAAPLYDEQGSLNAILLIFQDITQRQRAEEALRQSEERLRLALLVGKAGIWDWDIPHNRVTWSEQIYEFHGLAPGTFGGRVEDFAQLVHPDDQAWVSQAIRQALEEIASYELEFRVVQPSGAVRWLSTTGGVIFDAQGYPIRMLGATRDITERKAVEAERERLLLGEQRAREEAERANRIKDEFLAVLSHELRSPLNPILGWAKLLQSHTFDEQKTKHALATIERNALLQTQLIEDLLDVSRILRGKLVLNTTPVSLANIIEAALETVRLAADAKSIRIQQVLDPNVGQVLGESARLQQVIWNLLSNAVKFTPSGGTIEIRLEQINTHAQVQVKDTGKGITREFLPHVFDYFCQEDGTTTRKFGGLGLGLAIVRHLVELHGGTVWAESPGESLGATFTVRLPLMPVPTQTSQGNPPITPVAHLTGLRILVVDDQPDIQELIAFILEEAGAVVSVAASAQQALNLMEQSLPDVLICDIGMPDMDGYMLMRQIRTLLPEQGGKIPALSKAMPKAIALTAYAGEVDQQQALAAGFQKHIAKPVEPDELVRAVARLLEHP